MRSMSDETRNLIDNCMATGWLVDLIRSAVVRFFEQIMSQYNYTDVMDDWRANTVFFLVSQMSVTKDSKGVVL